MAEPTNFWLVSIERSLRVVSIPHIVFAFLSKNGWMRLFVQPHASYRMVENNFSHRVFECQTLKHHRFQTRHPILTRLAPMASSFQELYLAHEFFKNRFRISHWIEVKECHFFEYLLIQRNITFFTETLITRPFLLRKAKTIWGMETTRRDLSIETNQKLVALAV